MYRLIIYHIFDSGFMPESILFSGGFYMQYFVSGFVITFVTLIGADSYLQKRAEKKAEKEKKRRKKVCC